MATARPRPTRAGALVVGLTAGSLATLAAGELVVAGELSAGRTP